MNQIDKSSDCFSENCGIVECKVRNNTTQIYLSILQLFIRINNLFKANVQNRLSEFETLEEYLSTFECSCNKNTKLIRLTKPPMILTEKCSECEESEINQNSYSLGIDNLKSDETKFDKGMNDVKKAEKQVLDAVDKMSAEIKNIFEKELNKVSSKLKVTIKKFYDEVKYIDKLKKKRSRHQNKYLKSQNLRNFKNYLSSILSFQMMKYYAAFFTNEVNKVPKQFKHQIDILLNSLIITDPLSSLFHRINLNMLSCKMKIKSLNSIFLEQATNDYEEDSDDDSECFEIGSAGELTAYQFHDLVRSADHDGILFACLTLQVHLAQLTKRMCRFLNRELFPDRKVVLTCVLSSGPEQAYRRFQRVRDVESEVMVICEDTHNNLFAVYLPVPWEPHNSGNVVLSLSEGVVYRFDSNDCSYSDKLLANLDDHDHDTGETETESGVYTNRFGESSKCVFKVGDNELAVYESADKRLLCRPSLGKTFVDKAGRASVLTSKRPIELRQLLVFEVCC